MKQPIEKQIKNLPGIKIVMPTMDVRDAKVTDLDTGELIQNIRSISFHLEAGGDPFVMLEMQVYTRFEYQGPATMVEDLEPSDK